jgi:DNA-binding NarL/FixJ family response regulator
MLRTFQAKVMTGLKHEDFSPMEVAIVCGLANGLLTKDLASELNRSSATIEHYVKLLCAKTRTKSRAHLVAAAVALCLIEVG